MQQKLNSITDYNAPKIVYVVHSMQTSAPLFTMFHWITRCHFLEMIEVQSLTKVQIKPISIKDTTNRECINMDTDKIETI